MMRFKTLLFVAILVTVVGVLSFSSIKIKGVSIKSILTDFITYLPIIESDNILSEPTPTLDIPTDMPPNPTMTTTSTQTPETSPEPTVTQTTTPIPDNIIYVDHNSVTLFDDIPPNYLEAARNLDVLWADASVGLNISDSLNCLTASSWAESHSSCRSDYYDTDGSTWLFRTYTQDDYDQGLVPERILFDPDPVIYDRSNWTYELFEPGGWDQNTYDFIEVLAPAYLDSKDVLSYQLPYTVVFEGSDIVDPNQGYFVNNPDRDDIYDLEDFIQQHPDKIFIFWTTSLARSVGSETSTQFNNMMRQYAVENNKILFDVADIEAYTDLGVPCYDNRDGIEYCQMNGSCENYPDDGLNLPAICQDYTGSPVGGHLTPVAAGKIVLAKSFWVLMARIAGWDGQP